MEECKLDRYCRVEKFSLVKYDRGEMITITPLKFYLEKTQKKALLAIEAQNFGILHFSFMFDNASSEIKLAEDKSVNLRCEEESESTFKYLVLEFERGKSRWAE